MKKIIFILICIVAPLATFSQSVFDKFEDLDDVSAVIVNKNMFTMLSKISVETNDKEAQDFIDIAQSLTGLKMFATENETVANDMRKEVDKYLKNSSLQELMRVKDKDANVKFYIKQGRNEDHVTELLMFISDVKGVEAGNRKIETVLLTLTGDIDLNKISALTKRMNLPSDLEKVNKNK